MPIMDPKLTPFLAHLALSGADSLSVTWLAEDYGAGLVAEFAFGA
jgi:hypothetical protein